MDPRLEKALEFAKYSSTLENQKKLLHEQYLEHSYYYYNGGAFAVTPELINFVHNVKDKINNLILLDVNSTPIQIENNEDFYTEIVDIYVQSTNLYIQKYNELKKARSTQGLVDL